MRDRVAVANARNGARGEDRLATGSQSNRGGGNGSSTEMAEPAAALLSLLGDPDLGLFHGLTPADPSAEQGTRNPAPAAQQRPRAQPAAPGTAAASRPQRLRQPRPPGLSSQPSARATPATPAGTAYPSPTAQPGDPSCDHQCLPELRRSRSIARQALERAAVHAATCKSLTATDDQTVVFTFCNPDVAFLSKIAFSVFAINDSAWLIAHTAAGTQISTMNGTGPYKIDQWQRGSEIDYSAFDGYWGDKAGNAKAVLQWQNESAARLQDAARPAPSTA